MTLQWQCPRCSQSIPGDARFCRRCGLAIHVQPSPPPRALPTPPMPVRAPRRKGKFGWVLFVVFLLFIFRGSLFKDSKPVPPPRPVQPVNPSVWRPSAIPVPTPNTPAPTKITPAKPIPAKPTPTIPPLEREDLKVRIDTEYIRLTLLQQQKTTELTLARQRGQTRDVLRIQRELDQVNRDLANRKLER